jgi:hypothetical protein
MGAAENILEIAAVLPPGDRLRRAVEALGGGRADRVARLEQAFNSDALPLALEGQVSGYWIAPHASVPTEQPAWRPTGAVLPPEGSRLDAGATVLDLVPIDYVWFPLSEAGIHTYAHSAALASEEEGWRFVPCGSPDYPWPCVYSARLHGALPAQRVRELYGEQAAQRARGDFDAVQIAVVRE